MERRRRRRLVRAGVLYAAFMTAGTALAAHAVDGAEWSLTPESVRLERGRMPAGVGRREQTRFDSRLGTVAATLSGFGAVVRCWSPAGWARHTRRLAREFDMERLGAWRAYTTGDRLAIHLSPEVCAQLRRLTDDATPIGPDDSSDALAWSVSALAHEAQHAAGIRSERRADCYAMQSIRRAARLLGRSAAEGRYLATVYWKHWYVWHARRYRSRECRNGGRLDLRPKDDAWP